MSRHRNASNGSRLKICLISEDYPGREGCGGVGTYTYVLARGLARMDHRVHVITRDWGHGSGAEDNGVKIHRIAIPYASGRIGMKFGETWQVVAWNVAVRRIVRGICAEEGLDVIESPECRAQGLFASLMNRSVPMVVRLHGGACYSRVARGAPMGWSRWDTRISEHLERRIVRRARLLVSASTKLGAWCARNFRVDAHKIRNIPLPVDDDLFTPGTASGRETPTILYVGRISSLKGVDRLIEAFAAIVRSVPSTRLRLVGREEHGQPAIDGFRRRLRDAGLPESAAEFVGPVRRNVLPALYRSAAVCLVPSPGGSAGYTCLEAMASGCAVVAAVDGERHGVITDGVDGVLVPTGSAKALASTTAHLLKNPSLRCGLGDRAVQTVRGRFGCGVVCAETVETYRSVLD